MSPALQADSLPAEAPGKPKNTGGGSLSLLHRIFWTQESNWGILHCRRILYQLSYQGRLLFWTFQFNIGLAKMFVWVFLQHLMGKLEQTSWPTQYISQ